jgi:hypothetical protein
VDRVSFPSIPRMYASEPAICASINSNESLRDSVSGLYRGLPNVSRGWSPVSNTNSARSPARAGHR